MLLSNSWLLWLPRCTQFSQPAVYFDGFVEFGDIRSTLVTFARGAPRTHSRTFKSIKVMVANNVCRISLPRLYHLQQISFFEPLKNCFLQSFVFFNHWMLWTISPRSDQAWSLGIYYAGAVTMPLNQQNYRSTRHQSIHQSTGISSNGDNTILKTTSSATRQARVYAWAALRSMGSPTVSTVR